MTIFSEYPYKFVKVLKHQQLVEKETLTLLCELDDVGGDVQWFKGDQAITPDKRCFKLIINISRICLSSESILYKQFFVLSEYKSRKMAGNESSSLKTAKSPTPDCILA